MPVSSVSFQFFVHKFLSEQREAPGTPSLQPFMCLWERFGFCACQANQGNRKHRTLVHLNPRHSEVSRKQKKMLGRYIHLMPMALRASAGKE